MTLAVGVDADVNDILVSLNADGTGKASILNPVGSMLMYGGSAAPSGWLLCDGSAVSRTTYAALFAVISTTFGAGDTTTTFNVPDLQRRVPFGYRSGDTLGASDGVAAGSRATSTAHTHTEAHTHTVARDGWGTAGASPVTGRLQTSTGNVEHADNDLTSGAASNANTGSTTLGYQVVNFIIKT